MQPCNFRRNKTIMDTIPPLSLPILLDGATGSELYKRGMPAGACT